MMFFARHMVLWVGFFGATLATQEGRHIRIDALTKLISKRWMPIIELFIFMFCITVGFLLFCAAYKFTVDEKMAGTILFEDIPTWCFIVIMPVGFGIITFRYFLKVIELFLKFSGRKVPGPKAGEPSEIDISVKIKVK